MARRRDPELQSFIDQHVKAAPRVLVAKVIDRKLKEAGVDMSPAERAQIVEHFLKGDVERYVWNDGTDKTTILTFSEEDQKEVLDELDALSAKLPNILTRSLREASTAVLNDLKKNWTEHRRHQELETENLKANLEWRWGVGIERLRMMLALGLEVGERYHKGLRKGKPSVLRGTLSRLHARTCQITAEIIALLEEGYANGALARWRTLHEIGVVAALLAKSGEQLARRYVDHQAIEAKRASDEYESSRVHLGFGPISRREQKTIERKCRDALKKYGKPFGAQYGWAVGFVSGGAKPTFRDLETGAGRASMRSYYKMASYGVHAGPRGAFFSLNQLTGSPAVVAGASNVGLDEPGQLTALAFSQITYFVWQEPWTVVDTINMRLMISLRDEAVRAFVRAGRKLTRDERQLRQRKVRRRAQEKARRGKATRTTSPSS